MAIQLWVGSAIFLFGAIILTWSMLTNAGKHFAMQGLAFADMGAMFVAGVILPKSPERLAIVVFLGATATIFFAMYALLAWKSRSPQHAG